MRTRSILLFGAAMLAGALGGSLLGPHPAEAVAREIIDLQRDVTSLLQGQKDLSTQMTTDHTVLKTLVGQADDNVNKLTNTMQSVQKSVQDVQANSGARLDTMSTQVQGLSDNLEEIKSRLGKLNQQLVDLQSAVQSLDAKVSGSGAAPAGGTGNPTPTPTACGGATMPANGNGGAVPASANTPSGPPPSADLLYTNGMRDYTGGQYELATREFHDYLKYYGDSDLASNAQFYLGEIAFAQKQYSQAVDEYSKVVNNYPKSFKMASARYRRGLAELEVGQKTSGVRDLREVIRRYPDTDEEKKARARLKELGVSASVQ
jgi:tol-pal system protein YbgF